MTGAELLPDRPVDAAFGPSAARLAGVCAVLLGWSPDRFWRATPAEVRAVVDVLAPRDDAPVTRNLLDEMERRCGDG